MRSFYSPRAQGCTCLASACSGRSGAGRPWWRATADMYAAYAAHQPVSPAGAMPAELGAQAWLPWVFRSTRRLLTSERPSRYVVAVALFVGGLAVTHNITLLFAPVVLGCYILLLWWRGRTRRRALSPGWPSPSPRRCRHQRLLLVAADRRATIPGGNRLSGYDCRTLDAELDRVYFREPIDSEPSHRAGPSPARSDAACSGPGRDLGVAGRRDAEWLFFIFLTAITGIGISVWSCSCLA